MYEARNLIGGQWFNTDAHQTVASPFSGAPVTRSSFASLEHVDRAVEVASESFAAFSRTSAAQRAEILRRAAGLLMAGIERYAAIITAENGKSKAGSVNEIHRVVETFISSAEQTAQMSGEMVPLDTSPRGAGRLGFAIRVPIGVVAAITPFNSPMNLAAHKLGPALAAGNTLVLKPHEQTPMSATALVEVLLSAGLPSGVLNLVQGDGRTGDRLVRHPLVKLVSFTGGTANAEKVRNAAGHKKLLMELGGNAATIVHDDANIDLAVSKCVANGFGFQGQSCISVQRIYVQRNRYDEFVHKLVEKTRSLRVGDPTDTQSEIGPLIDLDAAKRIEDWIHQAVDSGARLLCGGERNGNFLTPAVLVDVRDDARVACEEVFGPVVNVKPYDTLSQAVAAVNDSRFGLQAGIFTESINNVLFAIRELEVGGLVVNGTSNERNDLQPYGGLKHSGIGREGPAYTIQEMTELRMVTIIPSEPGGGGP